MLKQCLALIDSEAKASKAVKEAQDRLDRMVLARYGSLTEVGNQKPLWSMTNG